MLSTASYSIIPGPQHLITHPSLGYICPDIALHCFNILGSTSTVHCGTQGLSAHPCSNDMFRAFPHVRDAWRALCSSAVYSACHISTVLRILTLFKESGSRAVGAHGEDTVSSARTMGCGNPGGVAAKYRGWGGCRPLEEHE